MPRLEDLSVNVSLDPAAAADVIIGRLLEAAQRAAESDWLLTVDQVAERIGVSPSTVYRMVKDGGFPRPATIGSATGDRRNQYKRWSAREVSEWIERLLAGREAGGA